MRQWYALQSKPRREASSAALLERASIETYVPQVAVRKHLNTPSVLEPFFPGYFFAHLDPQIGDLRTARYTRGVLQIVSFGETPCPVPDDLVHLIKERVAGSHGKGQGAEFHPGDSVIITRGPFQGTEAVFDRHLSAAGRVRVLIQILHRLCATDLYVGDLRLFRGATRLSQG